MSLLRQSHFRHHSYATIDDRLIKVMLQKWFTRVCEDPVLLADDEVRSFIESDFGVRPISFPTTAVFPLTKPHY